MDRARPQVLELTDVSSSYGRIEVLHGITLRVSPGKIVALIGSNGAGKTTLLRAVSGVQPISRGRITLEGQPLNRLQAHVRVQLGLAQVPEGRQIFNGLTVEDNLLLGGWTRSRGESEAGLTAAYDMFPVLCERRHSLAGSLSGGQQQMLAIGRALMSNPRILLMDEPSMGLSPVLIDLVFEAITHLKKKGLTILLVEQNASLALSMADEAHVMETGRIVLRGTGAELAADPRVQELYLGFSK
jgi:branched-chain amino acid transport system ATP-binding protein